MVKDTTAINQKNGNTYCTMAKEMENQKIAFQILPNGQKAHNGYHYVNCHMMFEVKMEDFRRKTCLVVGDHVS